MSKDTPPAVGIFARLPQRPRRLDIREAEILFPILLDACQLSIQALVRDITGDHHTAQEITQDAFLKLHYHLNHKRIDCRLIAWLRQVARNAALNHCRHRDRRPASLPIDAAAQTPAGVSLSDDQREQVRHISQLLTRLPERKRVVMELRALDGLTFEQVGEVAGCSTESAKKLFARTAAGIRASLATDCTSGDVVPVRAGDNDTDGAAAKRTT
jgi:RNA polymerase sigma-70 factor (ECF subfamily)